MAIVKEDSIARRSVQVLKDGQAPTGALIASPNFPTYHYAWFRDGAFCAHALDLVGERDRARAFHAWVDESVRLHRPLIERAIARIELGNPPPPEEMPPARYNLDGTLEQHGDEPWPNFQFDGYGMWLWALSEHLGEPAGDRWRPGVELVARYLEATWRQPSFSCWEELDGGEHAATLGATIAGLEAAAVLLDDASWSDSASRVRAYLLDRFVHDGSFTRGPEDVRVDGSLLWLDAPFGVVPDDDPVLARTVERVRSALYRPGGGVYRYLGDTYYGGGEWVLLACSLAWRDARRGDTDTADAVREWVAASALPNGDLPEQTTDHAQDPLMTEPWVQRWGPVATPLLWSHAMYLVMEDEVRR